VFAPLRRGAVDREPKTDRPFPGNEVAKRRKPVGWRTSTCIASKLKVLSSKIQAHVWVRRYCTCLNCVNSGISLQSVIHKSQYGVQDGRRKNSDPDNERMTPRTSRSSRRPQKPGILITACEVRRKCYLAFPGMPGNCGSFRRPKALGAIRANIICL
jgi:hypothetical protein